MCAKENRLLEVKDLRVHLHSIESAAGPMVKAVDGVDLTVYRGRTICLVGERGSGKSAVCRAIAGAVRQPEQILSGRLVFYPEEHLVRQVDLTRAYWRPEGNLGSGIPIALIGQESVPSLSILHTIGSQIIQAVQNNHKIKNRDARLRVLDLLAKLELPSPERLVKEFPFRLSSSTHLRVLVALALSCEPLLLIIDDPAVTLDFPNQARILDVISAAQQETHMAVLFSTHDPDLAAQLADDVVVMHQGKVVEVGNVQTIFTEAKHPYTQALFRAGPGFQKPSSAREMRTGTACPPSGCAYYPCCSQAVPECSQFEPRMVTVGDRHDVCCLLYETLLPEPLEPCEQRESDNLIWQLERFLMR